MAAGSTNFGVQVDLAASSFTVSFLNLSGDNTAALGTGGNTVEISLADLDLPGPIAQVNSTYSCIPQLPQLPVSCAVIPRPGIILFIASLGFTADSIDVAFGTIRAGETYTFDIVVPEPSALALLGSALVGAATLRGRRQRA